MKEIPLKQEFYQVYMFTLYKHERKSKMDKASQCCICNLSLCKKSGIVFNDINKHIAGINR